MPSDFDNDDPVSPITARGRDWPCLRQFCVFMENRVGKLHSLLKQIEHHDLRILALSVVDTVDFAVARIMVDETDRAREIFELSGLNFIENDILGVQLPDDDKPFVSIFLALVAAEINISYTYPLLFRRGGKGAIAVYVDDVDQAGSILKDQGHRLLAEKDLLSDDEYF
ncbi:acetolactate synthase [Thalassoglobus sp. JC818]|uniref:acetolactate synthase n=1 Tax=Thalassoglobus sp. JC818 TaxID=3232136 RepID=UPI0034593B91